MCNEYARRIALEKWRGEVGAASGLPPFEWEDQRIPNALAGAVSVRIGDTAPIIRLRDDRLVGTMTPWAWRTRVGKPVFNFVSEGRDFSDSDRVLILADGFYEYTTPKAAKVKLKDKHFFRMADEPWFWIAGIVKEGCFTMLTVEPGPDVAPYHDRQVVVLAPRAGLDWLTLSRPGGEILAPAPAGSLSVVTLRQDGVEIADPD